jgi:hypothetical protein
LKEIKKRKEVVINSITYKEKDELEDGAGEIPSPIRVAKECSKKGEYVNSASPPAHIIGCICIVLTHHSCQK